MIKVVIADDEQKVCQLIEFLVDWQRLDMEIVAVAHNGIDALQAIKDHQPDIIITDIKMPGCNGLDMIEQSKLIKPDLEYIVISGYKQFEYAQKAIQFGVSNYLLKPIDQDELNRTLTKMRQQYLKKHEQLADEERLEVYEEENRARKRKTIFDEILWRKKLPAGKIDIDFLNTTYLHRFRSGIFQTAAIKIDGIHDETEKNRIYIENKVVHELEQNLKECFEWDYLLEEGVYYLILNFPGDGEDIRDTMSRILLNLLAQQNVIRGFQVTIGLGERADGPEIFSKGFKAAKWAIDQRLVLGTNQVIQGEYIRSNLFVESDEFHVFNKQFCDGVELQDQEAMEAAIEQLEKNLLARRQTTGYEILQMCKETVNIYQFMLKKLEFPTAGVENFFRRFHIEIHNCGTAHETFAYLRKQIRESFDEVTSEKEMIEAKPIRIAKSYITEHLSEPISLESVSDAAGFNTAYFSTIFKKATGSTFSEYLLHHRMEKAKEMLRNTNYSVAAVCEAVGYSDVKHFTKNFTKYTSLKPKEYRKLYS